MKRRTDKFRQRLVDARAEWSTWRGVEVVERYTGALQEYWAVRDGGLGLVDRSERETLVIEGPDAITWLQGLVTNDLLQLERDGSGQRSVAVSTIGRTIADMRLLHIRDLLLVDLEPGVMEAGFLGHLKHHVIMEKVRLHDRTATTGRLTVTGRLAPELLDALVWARRRPSALTEAFQGLWGELAGQDVIVQRIPLTGEPTFDLFCDRDAIHRVWDALMQGSSMTRPVGHAALELMRMEAGEVRFGAELDEAIIPIEADLNHLISYDKGCYLGQEIIHRLDTRGRPARMLRVLVPEDPGSPLAHGSAIEDAQGKRVGQVRASFASPQLEDHGFALAYLKRGAYDLGERVRVDGVLAEVAPLGEPLRRARQG